MLRARLPAVLLAVPLALLATVPAFAQDQGRPASDVWTAEQRSEEMRLGETRPDETPGDGLVPAPLALSWGRIAEPAEEGTHAPAGVAEQLEFLQAHGWPVVRPELLPSAPSAAAIEAAPEAAPEAATGFAAAAPTVVLTFDDPASAHRYVLPLLALYRLPAVVTVGPEQAADPALSSRLRELAASEWVQLAPRVEGDEAAPDSAPASALDSGRLPRCGPAAGADAGGWQQRQAREIERQRRGLAEQVERLRALTGESPRAVAWEPGTWSGAAQRMAAGLGLTVQLPTFTGTPPVLEPPRVPRYRMPPGAGVWVLVQAAARWDPRDHPVRFVALDAGWICAGASSAATSSPAARVDRLVGVVEALGLNGILLRATNAAASPGGTGSGPSIDDVARLAAATRRAGVRQVILEVPADPARAAALVRAVHPEVVLLPAPTGFESPLANAVRDADPAVRLAVGGPALAAGAATAGSDHGTFTLAPTAPDRSPVRGVTVSAGSPGAAGDRAGARAADGWHWIGLPLELALDAFRDTEGRAPAALAAFALPKGQ